MRLEIKDNGVDDLSTYELIEQHAPPRLHPSVWSVAQMPTSPVPGDLLASEDGSELYVFQAGTGGAQGTWIPVKLETPQVRRQAVVTDTAGSTPATYPWVNPPLEGDVHVNRADDIVNILLADGTWYRVR